MFRTEIRASVFLVFCMRARATGGGAAGGLLGGAVGSSICMALGASTGVGGVVCAAVLVGAGTWIGTTAVGIGGEYLGDKIYEGLDP